MATAAKKRTMLVSYLTASEWSESQEVEIPGGITRAEWLNAEYKRTKRKVGTIRVRAT